MRFDWDENKNQANIKNHAGISFEEAIGTFYDEWAIEVFDTEHSDFEEQRFTIIGLVGIKLLRVTYTVRVAENGEELIRLITARLTKGYEKLDYEQNRNELDRRNSGD